MSATGDKHLRCSFCGKSKDSVKKFISGPSVYICNECVSLCNEILAEEEEREAVEAQVPSPTPMEIKDFLDEYSSARTPNPCIRCNTRVKFGPLLEKAHRMGCDCIATIRSPSGRC